MNKIYLTLILGMFMISLGSAISELQPVAPGECIDLFQYCDDCTYVNLTAIIYPESPADTSLNEEMTKTNQNFNYTFCNTTELGKHSYIVCGDKFGSYKCEEINFEVTPSGKSGAANTVFFVLVLILLYGLTLLFFFKREIELAPFVALTGMALGFLGLYMIRNGIIIFRDSLTNYISYVTIFVGFGLALVSLIEWIQDSM